MFDILSIRIEHRTRVVQHAFRVLLLREPGHEELDRWVSHLLAGGNAREMIEYLWRTSPDEQPCQLPVAQDSHVQNQDESRTGGRYAGRIAAIGHVVPMKASLPAIVSAMVHNESNLVWTTAGEFPVYASYHWLAADGSILTLDGDRTVIGAPILPGESAQVNFRVVPPDKAGQYWLQLTLVHEGLCWLEDAGLQPLTVEVTVEWLLQRSVARALQQMVWAREAVHSV